MGIIEPFISIVIPIYNVEKYIRNCIQSIINQNYVNYEVILVDDGSPDNSPQIALEMLKKAGKDVHFVKRENGGQFAARNTGERIAKGDWILFPDSDDVLAPNYLETMVLIIYKSNVEMISPDFQIVREDNVFKKAAYENGIEYLDKIHAQNEFLLRTLKMVASGTLYKLSWYREYNLKFRNVLYGEDTLFLFEALLYVNKLAHIKSPLYNYLYHPNSVMTSSKYEKIVAAYPSYIEIAEQYERQDDASPLVKYFIFPRYVLGILHSASKLCSKAEYKQLFINLEGNKNLKKMLAFPQVKSKLLALIGLISPILLYDICKRH